MSGHWELLSDKQQIDVMKLRGRMSAHLIAEADLFYKEHPELQLSWSFTCDALLRELSTSLREDRPNFKAGLQEL